MKKLLLLTLLFSICVNAQIKVIENEPCETIGAIEPVGRLLEKIEKCDNLYTFTYLDAKFSQIDDYKSFSFEGDENYNILKDIINKGLQDIPKDKVKLELENDIISIEFVKNFGFKSFKIYHTDKAGITGVTEWMNKSKFKKLFNK